MGDTKRQYEPVWDKLIADPNKSVRVRAANPKHALRVRKAVWKEKHRSEHKDKDGVLIKKRFRLTCEFLEDKVTMIFKLVLNQSCADNI